MNHSIRTDSYSTNQIAHLIDHLVSVTWLKFTRWHGTLQENEHGWLSSKIRCTVPTVDIMNGHKHQGGSLWISGKGTNPVHCGRKETHQATLEGVDRFQVRWLHLADIQVNFREYSESKLFDFQPLISRRQLPSLFITGSIIKKCDVLKPFDLYIGRSSNFFPAGDKPRRFYRPDLTAWSTISL